MKTLKKIVLVLVLGLAILIQLMNPTLAYADGETPTSPPDTQVETSTPAPADTPTDIAPTESPTPDVPSETPVPTDASILPPIDSNSPTVDPVETNTPDPTQQNATEAITETPVPTSTPAPADSLTEIVPTESTTPDAILPTAIDPSASNENDQPHRQMRPLKPLPPPATATEVAVTDQASLLDTVQTIPNNTSVVVLDANGQPLPLVTQDAANTIAQSDPVWCPAGQAPTPGANGCTVSYGTLGDLVANEGGNIAADGTIWITSGPVADANAITINGLTYTAWSNYTLTLQGGWSGNNGDTNIGANSVFNVPIDIQAWNNNITINDVGVENIDLISDLKTGLTIGINKGNITVSNSNFNNNKLLSSWSYGATFSTGIGTVTVTDSNFNNNPFGGARIGANNGNITINNSNFNNNAAFGLFGFGDTVVNNSNFNNNGGRFGGTGGWGASLNNGNITINNSNFNNNWISGLSTSLTSSDLEVNNSNFNFNGEGLIIYAFNTNVHAYINNSDFSNNIFYGLIYLRCHDSKDNLLINNVTFNGNTTDIVYGEANCAPAPPAPPSFEKVISVQSQAEISLVCKGLDVFTAILPNGDKVQIFCPVSGIARISRLDNTTLPADLPDGYTYASAFSLDIIQGNGPIPVITEGGHIKVSFVGSSLQAGNTYSILYWDNGNWIPLKDFMLDENGNPHIFDLNPGVPEDARKILSGVNIVTKNGSPRVEVSTNFPGIFVLAQH